MPFTVTFMNKLKKPKNQSTWFSRIDFNQQVDIALIYGHVNKGAIVMREAVSGISTCLNHDEHDEIWE